MSSIAPSNFSIITVFILFSIIGLSVIPFIDIGLEPSSSTKSIQVSFSWPEASARSVENQVTSRIEAIIGSIGGVNEISSKSAFGYGIINVSLKDGRNLDAARFELANLIRQVYANLPDGVNYPELSMDESGKREKPILTYSISAPESPQTIERKIRQLFIPQLAQVHGIKDVIISGSTPFVWKLKYDAKALEVLGIKREEVSSAVSNFIESFELGNGLYNTNDEYDLELPTVLKINTSERIDWSLIPIKNVKNRIIRLSDICDVTYEQADAKSYYRINGVNTINLQIISDGDSNTLSVSSQSKEIISKFLNNLPRDYKVNITKDDSLYLSKELTKVGLRALFSVILLLLVVILIKRSLNYLLIIISTLGISLLISLVFYNLFQVEIHIYSLAGITISLGIIIDNTLVMMDHLQRKKNKNVFIAIIAATGTSLGALGIIFVLDEAQKQNLVDFALVICINLGISLLVSYSLLPALISKLPIKQNRKFFRWFNSRRLIIKFNKVHCLIVSKSIKLKWLFILMLIISFGVPLNLIPDYQENNITVTKGDSASGKALKSFREIIPTLYEYLGGTYRLFTENVFEHSIDNKPQRLKLVVFGSMPDGCTIAQLNEAIKYMENFILQFQEIELFETSITDYKNGEIEIFFKEEWEGTQRPLDIKLLIERKALSLGGLDWSVYGVGKGFSNAMNTSGHNSRIIIKGYNYDQLYQYASNLKSELSKNVRVKNIDIAGSNSWILSPKVEYNFKPNSTEIALMDLSTYAVLKKMQSEASRIEVTRLNNVGFEKVTIEPSNFETKNIWDIKNHPYQVDGKVVKIGNAGDVTKLKSGNDIYRHNQVYQLIIGYDYIGPNSVIQRNLQYYVEATKKALPIGYSVEAVDWGWNRNEESQYYYILVVIAVIYFICSIILGSLRQPIAIMSLIPISFIGIFLTFYLFEVNFDQGGYGAFILISGLTVNSGIYIVNDFNNLLRDQTNHQNIYKKYFKAFNQKIVPIYLTIISTVAGLIPFIWFGSGDPFWYAFATGTIGGLVFSIIGIYLALPIFLLKKHKPSID